MPAIAVIPTYVRDDAERDVTLKTVETLRQFEPELEILVVDDCSPHQRWWDDDDLVANVELVAKGENEGFSRTVNVGLRQALAEGKDAILVNADIEFLTPIVETFESTHDSQDRPAAVVGALLLYPTGLIQHAGIYLAFYDRSFDHRFRYGPASLPEAHVPQVCPVTGALQYIRHSTLEQVGLYDSEFSMGFEDVDYCLRTFEAGLECVYQPAVRAVHHESMFRGQRSETLDKWHQQSAQLLREKHGSTPLGRYIMPIA